MTDIESVKNAQRLHHILQAVQRIHRSVGELSYEMFTVQNDLKVLEERIPQIICSLNMPSDFKFDQSADENNNVD